MTKNGAFIICLLIALASIGQTPDGDPTQQFSRKEYTQDFNQLVDLLKEKHPKIYAHISKEDFEQVRRDKLNAITDSISLGQFMWICDEMVASIQCGHTFVWWPKDFGMFPDSLLFPIETWTDGKRLFVKDILDNSDKVTAGMEIIIINGVDVQTILKSLYAASPSDGNIQSSKKDWANRVFKSSCATYFNYPEYFTVQVKDNDVIKSTRLNKYKRKEGNTSMPDDLHLKIEPDKQLAILTVHSFDYYEDEFVHFKAFIDSSFSAINEQGIGYLVVDLRDNGGGDSKCGSYLIEHFANKPYCYWPLDENAAWQKELHAMIQPNANRFKGKPYVLVNGGGMSTTGHVCSVIKENGFGILVGEEVGSTYTCNDNSVFDTLTHTGLQFRIPQTTFYTCTSSFSGTQGILPDVEVIRTIDDIVKEADPEMEYVLKQISP